MADVNNVHAVTTTTTTTRTRAGGVQAKQLFALRVATG